MRTTTLFALLTLVPLTACLEFGKSDDDDDDDDDDEEEEEDDTGWEEEGDDTGWDGEADADTDADTATATDADTAADAGTLTGGSGTVSCVFEQELLDAGLMNCTVTLVLGNPSAPPSGCPDCTHAGTLEAISVDDDCDWPDYEPGEYSADWVGLEIVRGVNPGTGQMFGHFSSGWLDLSDANREVDVGSSRATHTGTFHEDGFSVVESFTVTY